ncbi:type II toxin-antitoxin system Phd/YefM family antitoxin [Geomonas subterranea]|uniref:type II toxin-antitoxin system Phd/YefM family antitoxin n=1 Tax=Geomonas subterranea TaxID=2847989 RepID=UPI001CD2C066|nr:type II toxin-antitoxin system Phd/YefM family antitoxin [Geomonas fuzhouensis]
MKNNEKHSPHVGSWQLQDAKNRLSQVVNSARSVGPQTITLRGEPAAVVISIEEYRKMVGKPKTSLSAFFAQSPLYDVELDLTRSTDLPREVDL